MLMRKRQEILKEIEGSLGQSLTEDQQRRLESARDVGDQALMDLDRELGISLMEMRNRRRQAIDEALTRLLAHGATLVHEPVVTPWGDRNLRLADPDGTQITLFEGK